MKKSDSELDQILAPVARVQPAAEQMAKWKAMARGHRIENPPQRDWVSRSWQIAAAACIGFLIGAMVFKRQPNYPTVATNFDSTATIETIYVKGE